MTCFNPCIYFSDRFILIDWVIEVASMKEFSTLTVHLAVHLLDRYLCIRKVDSCKLQLLGITCLLLSSRWTSDIILTIREASWLTEKTYSYEEVVRMTGDVLAALKGNIRVCIHPSGITTLQMSYLIGKKFNMLLALPCYYCVYYFRNLQFLTIWISYLI